MEAGRSGNLKVGAVIQARMQSTRLPGKILLPLPFGSDDPLLSWPIVRLKKSGFINSIILATSLNKENDILKQFAEDHNIHFYQGSENNVLGRFVEAAEIHGLDILVRITGDNPIIDEAYIDELIQRHVAGKFDYSYSTNLPVGMNVEIANVAALKEISERPDLIEADEEHVTYFFKRHNFYKVYRHEFDVQINSDIRLTVDYAADYAALNLIAALAKNNNIYGLNLVRFAQEHYSWIFDVNASQYQKKQYNSLLEELPDSLKTLKTHEFKFTVDFLENHVNADSGNDHISIVDCSADDAKLLFNWVNDPEVRKNSLTSGVIQWTDHVNWFNKKITSGNSSIYVGLKNTIPFGQVRFDLIEDHFHIDYSIDKIFRGKGLGSVLLSLGINSLREKKQGKIRFMASVKKTNTASLKVFRKLNFTEIPNPSNEEISLFLLELN